MLKSVTEAMKPFLQRRIVIPVVVALTLLLTVAPAALAAPRAALVGPKHYYLALGDSLAFGYQPDLNYDDGYASDFYANLKAHGVGSIADMGCPGETSSTMINGGCPVPFLRKYPYVGPQLNAALIYLALLRGQVSPVTLDIGANDFLPLINTSTCAINVSAFNNAMATLDYNLRQVILPKLHTALTVNGQLTGDIVMMNYYDPLQNKCPNTVPYVESVNQHLTADASGYATIVDVFSAYGGATTPNPNICSYTWECSIFSDVHATDKGYSVIASTFEQGTGY